jgi:putative FmdB family regulatory protein
MPIYEYACSDCGHRFDVRQSWSDDALTVCPECTGAIRRVLHPAGVIFKGSGWYITDSRKNSGATESSSKSESTSESRSDSDSPASTKAEPSKTPEKTAAADA